MTDTTELAHRIRCHVVDMANRGKSSHIASCLSIADILAVLYGKVMRHDPSRPEWEERDRFVLSKGHAGATVYAALAECGYFEIERLATHYQDGSQLSGHVSHRGNPGVEISTGSLGHGLGIAAGMAYAAKAAGAAWRSFALLSDGELDEGSNWEAFLFASHHELSNLVAIVDYNKIQSLAPVAETLNLEPLTDKFEAFGWAVHNIDGHDHDQLDAALAPAAAESRQPTVVVCNTTKGKGVSFMENSVLWHYRSPQDDEYDAALKELGKDA